MSEILCFAVGISLLLAIVMAARYRLRLVRRRVFISYAHEDKAFRESLEKWLEKRGFVAEYDLTTPLGGKELAPEIKKKIRRSDCVIALGTRVSFGKEWVEAEVRYIDTLFLKPKYLPVLVDRIPGSDIPRWFTRTSPLVSGVAYVECFGGEFEALEPAIDEVRSGLRLPPGVWVPIALVLFIVVPFLIAHCLRPFVGTGDARMRELERWVEGVNQRIEGEDVALVVRRQFTANDTGQISYNEAASTLVARDVIRDGVVAERHFFRLGREVAHDAILVHRAENGTISQVKTRLIFPDGPQGEVVEDTFDSDGNLVSKRTRRSARERWTYYAQREHSIYPPYPFLAAYR